MGRHGVGNEAVQRQAAPHAFAQFGRADLDRAVGAVVEPQPRDIAGRLPRMAGARQDDEFRQAGEFPDVLPVVQPAQPVAADDPEEPVIRMQPLEMADGIDREAGPALAELELRDFKLRLRRDREAQHGEAITARGVDPLRLVRHLRRGHKDEAVQVVLGKGVLGGAEVPKMHRVESSA